MIHPALRIPLPFYGRLLIERNNKWYGRKVAHSPKKWPWWKLFVFTPCDTQKLCPSPNYRNWNCWVYTRNDAICVNVSLVHKSHGVTFEEQIKDYK